MGSDPVDAEAAGEGGGCFGVTGDRKCGLLREFFVALIHIKNRIMCINADSIKPLSNINDRFIVPIYIEVRAVNAGLAL